MKPHILVLALAAALAGCGSLPGPAPAPQIYLLDPPMPQKSASPAAPWQLSVAAPSAPTALDTDRIALTRNGTLDYYADAAWTDTAPKLLASKLVQALEASGGISGVASEDDALQSDYQLVWDIRAFEAQYTGDGPPNAVLAVSAKLVTMKERRVIGVKDLLESAPASANAMPAILQAFDAATGRVTSDIADWLTTLPAAAAVVGAPQPISKTSSQSGDPTTRHRGRARSRRGSR